MKKTVSYILPHTRKSKERTSLKKKPTEIEENLKINYRSMFDILDIDNQKSLNVVKLFNFMQMYGTLNKRYLEIMDNYFKEIGLERIDFNQFCSLLTGDFFINHAVLQARFLFEKFKIESKSDEVSFEQFNSVLSQSNLQLDRETSESLFKSISKSGTFNFEGFADHLSNSTVLMR